jgi:hypothetical protein
VLELLELISEVKGDRKSNEKERRGGRGEEMKLT